MTKKMILFLSIGSITMLQMFGMDDQLFKDKVQRQLMDDCREGIAYEEKKNKFFECIKNPLFDINQRFENGATPLIYATCWRRNDMVLALLSNEKCDVNLACQGGCQYTALHYATEHADAEIVGELVQRGAQTNCLSNLKETPLFLLCLNEDFKKSLACFSLLIEHKADITAQNRLGCTFMSELINRIEFDNKDSADVFEFLIPKIKSILNIPDKVGNTAFDYCYERNREKSTLAVQRTMWVLLKYGAQYREKHLDDTTVRNFYIAKGPNYRTEEQNDTSPA